jgi:O-antigen/teichoic acid export membrane protein
VVPVNDAGGGLFRRLVGGFATYGLGDLLVFGLSYFAIIPILTRNLTPEEYGVVATLMSVGVLLVSLLQFGLPSAVFRFFFVFTTGEERQAYFGSNWLFNVALSAGLSATILAIGRPIWDGLIRNAPFEVYAGYVVWGAFFQVFIIFRSVLLRAQERPVLYVILDVAQFICLVVLVLYYVEVLRLGTLGQVRAAFITHAVFAMVSVIILVRNVRLRFKWLYVSKSLYFALPVLVTYVIGFFLSRVNVLILQYLVVGGAVGVFALGQQLSNVISMASASFEKAWQPVLYSQSLEDGRVLMARFMSAWVPIYMGLALGIGLFAPEIVGILSSQAYAGAWIIVAICGLGAAFLAISTIANGAIYYAKRSNVTAWITAAGAVVNVVLNILLIPHLGITGAALANVITGATILLLNIWGMQKFFSTTLNYAQLLGAAGLACIILTLGSFFLNGNQAIPIAAALAIKAGALVLYTYFLWFFNIFPPKGEFSLAGCFYGLVRWLKS